MRYVYSFRATVAVILLTALPAALAQLPTATVLGVVRDATGAIIPGAQITARNVENGQTRTTITEADGNYRFPGLAVGSYTLRAEHEGLKPEVRTGLTLTVTQEAVVNFTLQVGGVDQAITVTADAPLVNTTSGSLGGLVNSDQMSNLPLNGRNYSDLILLQPGITNNVNKGAGGSTAGLTFISNGATLYSNNYLLDGTSMNQQFGGTTSGASGNTLGVEGIQEYKVVTNSFSAEYGITMGSQTLIVTKSGTDTFHGSLFEYVRNSALDARNFYDYKTAITPQRLPPFRRNNFGGSFGGPIKKDKTFFFGTYEKLTQRTGLTNILTTIPASARVNGGAGGVGQIAPVIQPFLPLFQLPNLPNNQFTYPYSRPDDDTFIQGRIDQVVTKNDNLFGRYTIDTDHAVDAGGWPDWHITRYSRNQFLTLSENHIFTPTLFNTFRASLTRTVRDQGYLDSDLFISGPQYSFVAGQAFGAITVGGLTANFGPSVGHVSAATQNIFAWSDDVFYTHGRHALKFGTLINRYQVYGDSTGSYQGSVNFPSLTAFLTGFPSSYSAAVVGSITDRTYYYSTFGFYGQDDFRVSSRLNVNLGLRYEFNTQYREQHNRHVTLLNPLVDKNTTITSPFRNYSLHNFSPRVGFAWNLTGDGKTALRGGGALLYDIAGLGYPLRGACGPPFCQTVTETIPNASPRLLTLPFTFPSGVQANTLGGIYYYLEQPHMLQYNLTLERQLPGNMVATVGYAGSRGIHLFRSTQMNPAVQTTANGLPFYALNAPRYNPNWGSVNMVTATGDSRYNSLQTSLIKRFSHGVQFQASYTLSRAIDDVPQAQGGSEATQSQGSLTNPFSNNTDKAVSNYDITHNLKFNAILRPPNPFPNGKGIVKIFNGWQASSILTLQGGLPFNPTVGSNVSRSLQVDRPNLLPGFTSDGIITGTTGSGCTGVPANKPVGNQDLWYNPCAFALQSAGFLGNVGRNILRGPGITSLDFALSKETTLPILGDRSKLQIRADAFNILNHANFAPPALGSAGNPTQLVNNAAVLFSGTNGSVPMPTAGVITQTSTSARQIQLGMRLVF